jgi:hypothetical protein
VPKYPYGKRSSEFLDLVDEDLFDIFECVAEIMNTTILPSTIRTEEEQLEFFRTGKSRTLKSKHLEGKAVDAAPYPVDWRIDKELIDVVKDSLESGRFDSIKFKDILENIKRWYEFVGIIKGVAEALDTPIRHGRDFKNFVDLPHTELKE